MQRHRRRLFRPRAGRPGRALLEGHGARSDHRPRTRGSTAAQVARATVESIAYQIRDVFETMQAEAGAPLQVLLVDGGATRNQALMQFQADILGVPVLRSLVSDVSALGAAYLAGIDRGDMVVGGRGRSARSGARSVMNQRSMRRGASN